MAPFDSAFNTKISPQIDGQVPDYIQADHPIFVEFLRQYYRFLESAQIDIDGTVDQVLLETLSPNFLVLDSTDLFGSNATDKIVFESGSGTTGKFEIGETITGSTSKATATILVDNDEQLFITANQRFIEGETITGTTSGAISTLNKYRANPVQNIQQLLEYADPDNTVDQFLSAFRDSFMESIPTSLASGVSKRNLIKQIRDLYAAKGTSEGHKLFFRIFLGQEATITYPAKYMLRMSDGNWSNPIAIRCTSDSQGALPDEMLGQEVTGASSGTTAQIISVSSFNQGTDAVVEFSLRKDSIQGTGFTASETISGVSTSGDFTMQFTIQSIVLSVTAGEFGGILYSIGDSVTLDPDIGNGVASAKVSEIKPGSISDIHIDASGSGYNIGDGVKFTNSSSDSSISDARAFVSVTGGRLSTEDAIDETPEVIVQEDATKTSFIKNRTLLDGTAIATAVGEPYAVFGTDRRFSDAQTYYYPLYLSEARAKAKDTDNGQATFFIFDQYPKVVFWMPSNSINTAKSSYDTSLYNLFVSTTAALDSGFALRLESGNVATGMDSETDSNTESILGDLIVSETESLARDVYGTDTDGIILEEATLSLDESSEVNRIFIVNNGGGYTALPSLTVSSENGTNAELVALTDDIGSISEIEVTDAGFKYATAPDVTANTNLILKDVTGTFGAGNSLRTHQGSVVSFDPSVNKLSINSTPTNRLTAEQSEATNDGITLEDFDIVEPGRPDHGPVNQIYKVNDEVGSGFLLDGFSEEGQGIALESFEIGQILSEALEVNVDQISMEISDMDALLDEGIELESGSAVPTDSSGKFLLNSHRPKSFRADERFEDRVKLQDEAAGTNIFGEQEDGVLLFDFSVDDVGSNISLEIQTSGGSDLANYNILLEKSTENDGDKLELDGSQFSVGDRVEYQLDTSIVFGNNTDSILLENSLPDGNGSPSYLVNEDQGNAIILNTSGGVDSNLDAGDKLLQIVQDVSEISNHGQSIKHSNTPNGRLLGEGLDTFVTEDSPVNNLNVDVLEQGSILYDVAVFPGDEDGFGNVIDSDGDKILNEHSGQNMLIDATDGSATDAGSQILMENETGTDQVILNQTQSDGTDSGDEVVMEDAFNVIGDTITDSSGASAKIIGQGTARGVAQIGTTITKPGGYLNTDSRIDEDIIRIQDSYFYQQFSYEVKVGAVLSDYIDELKASVHPAGFLPFGKVSLASSIAVRLGDPAAGGVIDYTGDDTFSPELASLFGVVFGETLQMTTAVREGVLDTTGGSSIFDTIIQENGVAIGDLILEETDGDNLQFESGLDIAAENSQSSGDGSILLDAGAGSGRLLAETALGENGIAKRSLSHVTTLKVRPEIKVPKTSYGAPLASGILPGSIFFDQPMIQLEDGMRSSLPAIMKDNLVLDGTDNTGTNAGDRISHESDLNEQAGIKLSDLSGLSINDLVEFDTIGFTEPAGTLKTNEGGIVFEQSAAADELVLETYLMFITEDGNFIDLETETGAGNLIGDGTGYAAHNVNIVLDGQLNKGEKLLTEGSKIEFEGATNNGSIPEGNFGNRNITQFTRESRISSSTSTNRLSLQDEYEIDLEFALEDGTGSIIMDGTSAVLDIGGQVLLDGTDPGKSDDGEKVLIDGSVDAIGLETGTGTGRIALDGTDASSTNAGEAVISEDGVIDVGDDIILDSTGGRDLNDKLIMFSTIRNKVVDNDGGFFLLSGTDGSSTNAGDEILLESDSSGDGTLQFLQQNSINVANGLPAESGGLVLPVAEAQAGTVVSADGTVTEVILITTFDSTIGTFDSTQTTFDAA